MARVGEAYNPSVPARLTRARAAAASFRSMHANTLARERIRIFGSFAYR
jgi:hypothetical protein